MCLMLLSFDQCAENLGMVMVFTLVSYALEWLSTHKEGLARTAKEEKERKKQELEEAERVSTRRKLVDL